MQPTWKQSPKQLVYDIRLHTKKPSYQKLHGAMGGNRPLRVPWIRHWLSVPVQVIDWKDSSRQPIMC